MDPQVRNVSFINNLIKIFTNKLYTFLVPGFSITVQQTDRDVLFTLHR